MKVKTKRQSLILRVKSPRRMEKAGELICYGLDIIVKVHRAFKSELKNLSPNTSLKDFKM